MSNVRMPLQAASLPRPTLGVCLCPLFCGGYLCCKSIGYNPPAFVEVSVSPFPHFVLSCFVCHQIPAVAVPVRELAVTLSKKAREVMSMLRQMGETNVSPNFMVDPDIAQMVAKEFGLRTKLRKLRNR